MRCWQELFCNFPSNPLRKMTIVCGSSHAFVIDEEGSVWGFGETKSGKLGTPASTSIFTKVELPPIERAAGCHHSVFLDESGILWVCGENLYGQLEGQQIGKNGPVKNQLQHVPKLVDLSCGDYHTILLDIDKNVWAVELVSLPDLSYQCQTEMRDCLHSPTQLHQNQSKQRINPCAMNGFNVV